MSVNTYLQGLGSSLVLSSSEKSSISTSVDTIKSRLTSYFGLNVTEKKLYGSYVRETILPRKADEKSDVDLMVVFRNPYGYQPQTFLIKLKKFAEYYYSRSEIYQSSPTIVLELNHIKFELTPAFVSYGLYYIPKNSSEWMYTDPDGFYSKLTECNKKNSYKIKPVVRILKHWNIQKNYRDIASFELEREIAEELMNAYLFCTSYTDYLKYALEKIKYSTNYTRVNKALDCIAEALRREADGYPCLAESKIKEAFPEV